MIEVENCKYRLPCNWCDKFNKFCDMSESINSIEFKIPDANICNHDWEHKESYINTETGMLRHKYICNKCHEVRMVNDIKELND